MHDGEPEPRSSTRTIANRPPVLAVGIGVQRAGTSWMFRALEEHPAVAGLDLPNNKEPDFFTAWWDRGEGSYARMFPAGARVGLDFSVAYFPSLDATTRLHAVRPDARVVVCLRDPVDRALSHHRFHLTRGAADVTFDRALVNNTSMTEQSRYGTHLARWIDAFGRDRLHVVLLEDIRSDPVGTVAGACRFLGLEPHVPTVAESRINAPDNPRRRWIRRVMSQTSYGLRSVGGARLLATVERTGVPGRLRRHVRDEARELTASERAALEDLRRELADEIRQASHLVGRNLDHWLP